MNNIEKVLKHMFYSKYVFFRPHIIAQRIYLEEKRVVEIIESMEKSGVVKKASVGDTTRYFLTLTSAWILRNLSNVEKIDTFGKENKKLRELLWLNHGCLDSLYGDDGEMQCNKCMIDFKRNSAEEIACRFAKIGILNIKKDLEKFKNGKNETLF